MSRANEISAETVRSLFDYDKQTGHLLHKTSRGLAKKGQRAGTQKPTGYRVMSIHGRWFQSARVVWLHQYGEWPKLHIDHINHIRDDERLENLREVTPQQNSHNLGSKRKNNTSGMPGVTWNERSKKWYAAICVNRKPIFLGSYSSYEDAVQARMDGKKKHHQAL